MAAVVFALKRIALLLSAAVFWSWWVVAESVAE
jgi:hypothetical protein